MNKPSEVIFQEAAQDPAGDPRQLAGQLGREIASPLASALERVISLTDTGKIRRNSLAALRTEIEQALRAGTAAQQLCEIINHGVRPRPARLDLHFALHEALSLLRGPGAAAQDQFRGTSGPLLVTADPTLSGRLLTALAQWAMFRGEGPTRWLLEPGHLTVEARVVCAVSLRPDLRGDEGQATLDWRLVHALCEVMGVRAMKREEGGNAVVTLEFPRLVSAQSIEGMLVEELDPDEAVALYASTVAGTNLLIVAGRRETREVVAEAVKPLGLICDFARSIEEAREFCDSGLPHAIVYEPTVRGVPFEPLRIRLLAEAPSIAMVEIHDEERAEHILNEIRPRPRAMRQSLPQDLPNLLMNELARSLQQ